MSINAVEVGSYIREHCYAHAEEVDGAFGVNRTGDQADVERRGAMPRCLSRALVGRRARCWIGQVAGDVVGSKIDDWSSYVSDGTVNRGAHISSAGAHECREGNPSASLGFHACKVLVTSESIKAFVGCPTALGRSFTEIRSPPDRL